MKALSEMFDPAEIQKRLDLIGRHRDDLHKRFDKLDPSKPVELRKQDRIRDPQLACYCDAWNKLQEIKKDIADGIRDENGDVIPGA